MRSEIPVVDTVVTEPADPALDLDYVKASIQALGAFDDLLIQGWIGAASSWVEEQTGRQLITATRELWLDRFPGTEPSPGATEFGGYNVPATSIGSSLRIELPRPPLQSVVSVIYVDSDGALATLDPSTYQVKTPTGTHARRGWIEPAWGQSWPAARAERGAVRIQYVCGYGDTEDDIPDLVKTLLCYYVANYDQYRPAAVEFRGTLEVLPWVTDMLNGLKWSALPTEVNR